MTESTPCLEVAVYTARDADSVQARAHRDLATFPGFLASLPLVGLESSESRCDLVLWQSLQAAGAAAEAIQRDERFADFMGAVGEIRHFAHYDCGPDPFGTLADAALVEVAAYEVKEPEAMRELQRGVHRALGAVDGAFPAVDGVEPENAASLLDVIGWSDPGAHAAAPEALMTAHPELAPFFDGMAKTMVFELYRKLE